MSDLVKRLWKSPMGKGSLHHLAADEIERLEVIEYTAHGLARDNLDLLDELRYIAGIVERGTGSPIDGDQPIPQAVLKYVMDLEAIVNKLPKTADGVPVVPGDVVYWAFTDYEHFPDERYIAWPSHGKYNATKEHGDKREPLVECYSTREAAEASNQ